MRRLVWKLWRWVEPFWLILSRPSIHFSLGFLTIGGFVAGIMFWGGFNTALELTNTETFCVSCHEMRDNVFAPRIVRLAVGGTIEWTNEGRSTHNVTADDGAFASSDLAPGDAFEESFPTAGAFPYFCRRSRPRSTPPSPAASWSSRPASTRRLWS